MNIFATVIRPERAQALGATLGQDCMSKVGSVMEEARTDDRGLVFDFSEVSAINASFLKATVFWSLQCGQLEVQQKQASSGETWAVRPLRLFPVVFGCGGEVADDLGEFFMGRGLPILHVDKRKADQILTGRILGVLDPVLQRTLNALAEIREGTAADLASRSGETISVNGWNNRLADLHLLRLARRRRAGKFWIYSPIANSISLWA